MKKFVFLTYGYETPTQEIMDVWGNWFASIGDKMVDNGGKWRLERKSHVTESMNCRLT